MTEPPALVIEPLDTTSRIALRGWLSSATRLGIDVGDLDSIEAAYERYLQQVRAQPAAERADPTETLTAIAMALGEHLRRNSTLDWRVVTDAQGRDLAIASPDEIEVLFPIDPVADAWQTQQEGWMRGFVDALLSRYERGER
ncbi:DUF3806 domain-containing protein [Calidifontibacter sp. DB0510]|uniref:DUF3806 domain-containing protein n=1 Tax=Metallococcus carri TaxID=1656884 RepID=A0A967EAG4_9MICO|nr:DUF3806 domain-containing protein [Metallococcus carri]NHN57437.1 DUF3806 domain-containing protein [Metallococcus carri]NOP39167.1 DUF3806 domain-containing protein [Calidifontibacter sp. DB2511S]